MRVLFSTLSIVLGFSNTMFQKLDVSSIMSKQGNIFGHFGLVFVQWPGLSLSNKLEQEPFFPYA
jgi:hypothetical protein